jgi:hypothetical protein
MTKELPAFLAMLAFLAVAYFALVSTASPSERPEAFYQQTNN